MFSTCCDSAWICSMDMKHRPFNRSFILWNTLSSQVARSGEWAGWGIVVMLFFVRNSVTTKELGSGALSWCNNQSPFFTSQTVCASHFPLVMSKPLNKNSHWQSDQVEQTPYAQYLECTIKKMISITLMLLLRSYRLPCLPLWILLLCFWVIVQPWFITSYDPGHKLGSYLSAFCNSGHTWTRWSQWSLFKRRTYFAAVCLMFSSSGRMRWLNPYDGPMLSQSSWKVCHLCSRITSCTIAIISGVVHVGVRP